MRINFLNKYFKSKPDYDTLNPGVNYRKDWVQTLLVGLLMLFVVYGGFLWLGQILNNQNKLPGSTVKEVVSLSRQTLENLTKEFRDEGSIFEQLKTSEVKYKDPSNLGK